MVALKFLRPCTPVDDSLRQRLLNEARAAALLDHPNICTIFEVGESDDGEIFIAMPCYEGETLDRVISRGGIPLRRALGIALQIARGLAAAHQELLVHGDVKPANVMLARGDTVKILDFGLARLFAGGHREGATVNGTPAYMSPEQLRGEPVDQRTDIWSLGVVLYEMIAACRPFAGDTLIELSQAILQTQPVPLSIKAAVPASVERIVGKALAKNVHARYENAELLAAAIQDALAENDSGAVTVRRPVVAAKCSLAVLPFVDMSPEKNQQYLCEGIAEEIFRALNRIPDLYVVSRTSSFQFRDIGADIREIGARLDVASILEGSVRRAGDRLRVSAQLVNAADGYRIWYERFDREMKDIFAIEDEIAEQIASALEVTLTSPGRVSGRENDAEAYELYLQGRQFFHQHRRKPLEIAIQTFSRALEIHPGYARALAGIADCHSFLCLYFGGGAASAAAADEASRKAIECDGELAETRTARGLAHFVAHRYDEAKSNLQRALRIDPRLYDPHYIFGRICFAEGDYKDAARHFRRACAIVPQAYDSWYLLGMCYRRLDALEQKHAADLECIEAVKQRIRHHPDDTRARTMGAAILAQLGEPERAREWTTAALSIDAEEPIVAYNAACVLVMLGDLNGAIELLETLAGRGVTSRAWLENDPDLDPLRSDPRFARLLEKLPP